ncbi:tetratricopeptide repeat-containing glycosyltransferase family 2 protein [Clostridium sp.]
MNNKISLCMIVKNEESYLTGCLNSIKDVVDEIIIVDTGSTDKTVEIAQSFGAKIYYFQWNNNFSEARNESLKYATKDWILIMDADDEFCSDDKEKFKSLLNTKLNIDAVYYFETLNYCGPSVENSTITVNLNPRLFANTHGFHYEGEVHNQLVNSEHEYKGLCDSIRIYHYGYLDKNIISKDKRNRNITLLEEQIRKDGNNKYAHFNLGNEYFALGDIKKALEHYYKSYDNFDSQVGYGAVLIARIVLSHYAIREFDKTLEFADIGVKYFPALTDLYFLKALAYKDMNKPTLQIKMLEKCIEMGDPPSELKFLYGTGSFRAFLELGEVYLKLKDYDTSYKYYVDTIRSKSDLIDPVYSIGHILKEKKTPVPEFKNTIENFFSEYPKAYPIIADLFYNEGYYAITLDYLIQCEKGSIIRENLLLLKAKCLVRTGAFDECIKMNTIGDESSYYFYFTMCKVLSLILTSNYKYAMYLLNSFEDDSLLISNKKTLQVYEQLIKLFTKESTDILSEDENEKEYTPIIFEICEILLINQKLDEFLIALNLLNLISDKSVLLLLGKLYYKHGFVDMAKAEIIRSIKEFELYDAEGLNILTS